MLHIDMLPFACFPSPCYACLALQHLLSVWKANSGDHAHVTTRNMQYTPLLPLNIVIDFLAKE